MEINKTRDYVQPQVSQCAPGRDRTCDRRIRSPLLYPLSYGRPVVKPNGARPRSCRIPLCGTPLWSVAPRTALRFGGRARSRQSWPVAADPRDQAGAAVHPVPLPEVAASTDQEAADQEAADQEAADQEAAADRVEAADKAAAADRAAASSFDLLEAVESLRSQVVALRLELEVDSVATARQEQDALRLQLDDYLLPRLRRMDAPLLAVVGGSTGAGKSTLVNSLVRREVTRSGVLRPTTRSPVLVHHPHDSGAFLSQRILPGLARVTSEAPEPREPIDVDAPRITAIRLVPDPGLAPGLALLDAPDVDSVVETNRDLAVQLLAAADLWLFVTTAARYADALPWDLLRQAVQRGVSVAVVLDRVPAEVLQMVRIHLATMLRDQGLADAPVFAVTEVALEAGFLPAAAVEPLREWLTRLARDARTRALVVSRTLSGALDSLTARTEVLASAAEAQAAAYSVLREALDAEWSRARSQVSAQVGDGTLVRGEVLARWQEIIGTGKLLRAHETRVGRMRDTLATTFRGRIPPVEPLREAMRASVEAMVRAQVAGACEGSVQAWRTTSPGSVLVADDRDLARPSPGFDERLGRAVRDWQGGVLELVRTEGQHHRDTARTVSLGVDGTGIVLMFAVLAHTGGVSGTDVAVGAGTAEVAPRVLEAVFGDQAVRSLAASARKDLVRRIDSLMDGERARVQSLLDAAGVRSDRAEGLRRAVRAVEGAR